MKRIVGTISLILILGNSLYGKIGILGKKEMVNKSELIAIVNIQELITTDKTRTVTDLIAKGYVMSTLKGKAKGEIKFRIPRFFPCAAFDVSTGNHLVFLKKNDKDEYVGVNWYMSYIYINGKTVKWYDKKGAITDIGSSKDVINETKKLIEESDQSTTGSSK